LAGGWRRLYNEELYNLFASPTIIRVIKSRRIRWAGHVALMEQMRIAFTILIENLKERNHLEHLGVDGKIISKWILGSQGGKL
jgi:hypothetical protein